MGRLSQRNKQVLYYATYVSKEEIKDEYDNPTGQFQITYSAPTKAMYNIGFVESDAEVAMFGISATSTLRIVVEKDGFPLNETSILWYGKTPATGEEYDGTKPNHNYVVAGIRPSLNELAFYARRVEVSSEPDAPEPDPDPEGPTEPDEP